MLDAKDNMVIRGGDRKGRHESHELGREIDNSRLKA
jgi:hypothetical protein